MAVDERQLPILKVGLNCWRRERASNAAVLVDADRYFRCLRNALKEARRSVLIVGWDFDGRIRISGAEDRRPETLGPFLRCLVEEAPQLEVKILVWSLAVVHGAGARRSLILGSDWQQHPRIKIKLDTTHQIHAAHHQKIVVIDDGLAFCGGIDLTGGRWDSSSHLPDDPVRQAPDGRRYQPVHDVQMVVSGPVARALGDICRERWLDATGEPLEPVTAVEVQWPAGLKPDFHDTSVAISRTAPQRRARSQIDEVARITVDALNAAHGSIYIESQYFTARIVGDVLANRLKEPDPPEIVIVGTRRFSGWIERWIMGKNRNRLIRRLGAVDHKNRLRVYHPLQVEGGEEFEILVHSKLMIVDDRLIRIGSANLDNRSMGLDTECDLTIEASSETERSAILRIRDQLIGEHMSVRAEDVRAAVDRNGGSIDSAIDQLNKNQRQLRAFGAGGRDGRTVPVFGTGLVDPERPWKPLWPSSRHG